MQIRKQIASKNLSMRAWAKPLGLMAGLMLVSPVQAEQSDLAWGQELHANNCAGCHVITHDDSFYESRVENSDLGSRDSLFAMVQRCANNANLPWFDEEVEAVTTYLNQTYYKYD